MATAKEYKPKAGDKVVTLTDRADFKVNYPKEYKGKKHMVEGKVYEALHIDHAKSLEDLGIGKVVKEYSVLPESTEE